MPERPESRGSGHYDKRPPSRPSRHTKRNASKDDSDSSLNLKGMLRSFTDSDMGLAAATVLGVGGMAWGLHKLDQKMDAGSSKNGGHKPSGDSQNRSGYTRSKDHNHRSERTGHYGSPPPSGYDGHSGDRYRGGHLRPPLMRRKSSSFYEGSSQGPGEDRETVLRPRLTKANLEALTATEPSQATGAEVALIPYASPSRLATELPKSRARPSHTSTGRPTSLGPQWEYYDPTRPGKPYTAKYAAWYPTDELRRSAQPCTGTYDRECDSSTMARSFKAKWIRSNPQDDWTSVFEGEYATCDTCAVEEGLATWKTDGPSKGGEAQTLPEDQV